MWKKVTFILFIFLMIMLAACQKDNQTKSDGIADQSNQPNTEEAGSEHKTANGDDASADDKSSSDEGVANEDIEPSSEEGKNDESNTIERDTAEQDTSPVKEENYSSEEEAVNAIEEYREVEQTNADLGNGIKGFVEGAAGHQYVSWNEGNWLVEIDFPSDSQYAVDMYEDGEVMAKSIVNYLEDHTLPPPDQRGTIKINGFSDHPETSIRWQQGAAVYEIDQKTADPIEALQVAVNHNQ